MKITEKLETLGIPDALKENSEVCVLCAIRYHEVYGLSLDIYDIDPTFGESRINLNRINERPARFSRVNGEKRAARYKNQSPANS